MRVLLVNPKVSRGPRDFVLPPLGLSYLAAELRRRGVEHRLLDANALGLELPEVAEAARRYRPDVVGVTAITPTADFSMETARWLRPRAGTVVMGGPHATAWGRKLLDDCDELDIVLTGEAEQSFADLVLTLGAGGDPLAIPGVITREGQGPPHEAVADLDTLAWPARDLLPASRYRYPIIGGEGPLATVVSSRGCPYQCTFCDKVVMGDRYRQRSVEGLMDELEEIVNVQGARWVVFFDDLFILNRKRVMAICEAMLRRNIQVKWKCEGRTGAVDAEMLALMKRAGCEMIAFGVESVNQHGLDYLKKGTKADAIAGTFRLVREAGIRSLAYFILGIPNETMDDARRTIEAAVDMEPTFAQFGILSPYAGTELYEQAEQSGLLSHVRANNPYGLDARRQVVLSDNWDEARLAEIVREAHRRFYMRPSYVMRQLRYVRGPSEIAARAGTAARLAVWIARQRLPRLPGAAY